VGEGYSPKGIQERGMRGISYSELTLLKLITPVIFNVMNSPDFFDNQLLESMINKFYGYGNYQGDYWFIGMEESGGDFANINHRINTWSKRGGQEIEDMAEYYTAMAAGETNIQPTWKGLIRIILSAKGYKNITTKHITEYQINSLGRKNKETCLLELFPLPSPSTRHWLYGQHSQLSFLTDRDTYRKHCVEKRVNHLNQKIVECQPKAVVFYGKGYEYYWKKLTDVEFLPTIEGFLVGKNSQTIFVIAKHPVAFGTSNEYFHNIGKLITSKFSKK